MLAEGELSVERKRVSYFWLDGLQSLELQLLPRFGSRSQISGYTLECVLDPVAFLRPKITPPFPSLVGLPGVRLQNWCGAPYRCGCVRKVAGAPCSQRYRPLSFEPTDEQGMRQETGRS